MINHRARKLLAHWARRTMDKVDLTLGLEEGSMHCFTPKILSICYASIREASHDLYKPTACSGTLGGQHYGELFCKTPHQTFVGCIQAIVRLHIAWLLKESVRDDGDEEVVRNVSLFERLSRIC